MLLIFLILHKQATVFVFIFYTCITSCEALVGLRKSPVVSITGTILYLTSGLKRDWKESIYDIYPDVYNIITEHHGLTQSYHWYCF